MLSIEEIQLMIEKLRRLKNEDFQKIIDSNLKILEDLAEAVDANNKQMIDRLDKTPGWFTKDLEKKREKTNIDDLLFRMIQTKIFQFSKTNLYNCIEIGPGNGMFSKELRSWRKIFFLDIHNLEEKIRRRFHPGHQKHLLFFTTDNHSCDNIPKDSCNFVFSWDTFVFFTQTHVKNYLESIKQTLIPGGYCFIQYSNCHDEVDLHEAKRGYYNYNTKPAMEQMIKDAGYEVVEMNQFRSGANYAIFRKPGKQNPVLYKVDEITLD